MHARVAYFKLRSGTFEEVVRIVESPGGLLEIFRGLPGFRGYELIESPAGLVSVSHWETSAQADDATRAAAAWVAETVDDRIKLQRHDIGEVVLSATPSEAAAH